jgi:hypothetical protein
VSSMGAYLSLAYARDRTGLSAATHPQGQMRCLLQVAQLTPDAPLACLHLPALSADRQGRQGRQARKTGVPAVSRRLPYVK